MIFNTKAAQKNAGQKLTDHYLLNELWNELDETSQAAVSGGSGNVVDFSFNETVAGKIQSGNLNIPPGKNLIIDGLAAPL